MPEFTRDGVHLVYDDEGSGPAVLFSHCWYCDARQWPQVAGVVRAGYRALNLHNRGHGRSGPHRLTYTMADLGDDLMRVLDVAGVERAVLVGLSLGGFAAMHAAVRYPSRVRGMIVAGVIGGVQTRAERLEARMLMPIIRTPARPVLYPTLIKLFFGPTTRRTKPDLIAEWRARFASQDPASMAVAGAAALIHRDDFTDQLARISVPTLVIMGEEDPEVALAASMAAAIPGARFVSLPAAGHLSSVESPEAFEKAMLEFLAGLDAPAAAASTVPLVEVGAI